MLLIAVPRDLETELQQRGFGGSGTSHELSRATRAKGQ